MCPRISIRGFVHPSVGPSVRPSVRPSVGPPFFFVSIVATLSDSEWLWVTLCNSGQLWTTLDNPGTILVNSGTILDNSWTHLLVNSWPCYNIHESTKRCGSQPWLRASVTGRFCESFVSKVVTRTSNAVTGKLNKKQKTVSLTKMKVSFVYRISRAI